jgi:hypothetical protein
LSNTPGLAAHSRQQRVRTLLPDHFFCERHSQRFHVSSIGQVWIGHDGGRIGIDQHHFKSIRPKRLASLRPGIIKLTSLPDNDRAGAYYQDSMNVSASRHLVLRPQMNADKHRQAKFFHLRLSAFIRG